MQLSVDGEVVVALLQVTREEYFATQFQIDVVCDTNVDDAQESLVALLELALVKDLNGEDGGIGDSNVKAVVPVGVQRLFDYSANREERERETEKVRCYA